MRSTDDVRGQRLLFSTPLLQFFPLSKREEVDELRDIILQQAAREGGVSHSNVGGWQSSQGFISWSGAIGLKLLQAASQFATRNTLVVQGNTVTIETIDWQVAAWANVNRSGDHNVAHAHPGCFWSGCFYADDGGIGGEEALGGAIEFEDPRGVGPMMYAPFLKYGVSGCVSAGLAERVYPQTGMLLIFPSWLRHSVTPYSGTGTRVSVAFNFSL